MTKAQQMFESIMCTKGHTNFGQTVHGRYVVPSLQVRWVYFRLGWEMREVTK